MELLIALTVALLFAGGFYLVMRRHLLEVLLGTMLMSHGTNLLLLSLGGWQLDGKPPILAEGEHLPLDAYVNPLPQALILTAIVIGFGVSAFLIVLMLRGHESTGSMEVGELEKGEDEA